jgi:hypothetical protein
MSRVLVILKAASKLLSIIALISLMIGSIMN